MATQWIQSYPCKKKTCQETQKSLQKFLDRRGSQKWFTLTILLNLANPVKICPGILVRQHHTDQKQMGLLREQRAELRKGPLQYCCNWVWMKIGRRIPWSATAICETFKLSCLIGRHLMRGSSEYHVKARLFRLERW